MMHEGNAFATQDIKLKKLQRIIITTVRIVRIVIKSFKRSVDAF
jgi:hypothetical protein